MSTFPLCGSWLASIQLLVYKNFFTYYFFKCMWWKFVFLICLHVFNGNPKIWMGLSEHKHLLFHCTVALQQESIIGKAETAFTSNKLLFVQMPKMMFTFTWHMNYATLSPKNIQQIFNSKSVRKRSGLAAWIMFSTFICCTTVTRMDGRCTKCRMLTPGTSPGSLVMFRQQIHFA